MTCKNHDGSESLSLRVFLKSFQKSKCTLYSAKKLVLVEN